MVRPEPIDGWAALRSTTRRTWQLDTAYRARAFSRRSTTQAERLTTLRTDWLRASRPCSPAQESREALATGGEITVHYRSTLRMTAASGIRASTIRRQIRLSTGGRGSANSSSRLARRRHRARYRARSLFAIRALHWITRW